MCKLRINSLMILLVSIMLCYSGCTAENEEPGTAIGNIAFYSNRDGLAEIYVMDAEGMNVQRLTDNSAADVSPSWSPDGSRIVFVSDRDGNYEIYTSLIEDLVSDGFVVASVNHPYISGITVFPDGRAIRATSIRDISLKSIIGDAKFVLDFLTKLNNTDQFFSGRFDLSKVGMFGHSFGGASTIMCLYEDSRFKYR